MEMGGLDATELHHQQTLRKGPTSHTAARNFLAAMIERERLPSHILALITRRLPHKSGSR